VDALSYVIAAVVLLAIAAAACMIPAVRAAAIEPAVVLRE